MSNNLILYNHGSNFKHPYNPSVALTVDGDGYTNVVFKKEMPNNAASPKSHQTLTFFKFNST